MDRTELQQAIKDTLLAIEAIKREIAATTDPARMQELTRRKKELQYLQLWHLEQLELKGAGGDDIDQ
ncbi:MAG: hypothetical protein GYA42_07710 [Syntrophomonadaceae bacterium]|nr:hypothetical protein [Syntrophomonadaceae bacterium]